MTAQQVSAKSLLHNFLDRAGKGLRPTYTTSDGKNAVGQFECICVLPKVCTPTGSFESQQFSGEGASRSMASAKAAGSAWAFVQGTRANEAFQVKRFKQDFWTTLCSSFTPEVDPWCCVSHHVLSHDTYLCMHDVHQPAAAQALQKRSIPSVAMSPCGHP